MPKRLTYSDIQDLPADHELVQEFERQVQLEDQAYDDAGPITSGLEDEESLTYFNRYIAGDR